MSDVIMAVDLGRFKCVISLYRRSSREAVFRTIDMEPSEFLNEYRQLADRINECESVLNRIGKADMATQLLETIPDVGPLTAEAMAPTWGIRNGSPRGKLRYDPTKR